MYLVILFVLVFLHEMHDTHDLSFGPQHINVCLNGSQFWTTAY